MIRKLRNKFIIVTMGMLTVIFAILFIAVSVYNRHWEKIETLDTLEWIAEIGSESFMEAMEDGSVETNKARPYYAVRLSSNGEIWNVKSSNNKYNKNVINKVVLGVLKNGKDECEWKDYLYYIKEQKNGEKYIIFKDMSMSGYQLQALIGNILLLNVGLVLFFIVSLYLSHFVTKPAEEMLRREKEFISNASHELKTPVASIKINAQVIAADGYKNRFLDNILFETNRMSNLVNELLTFSYLEEKGREIPKAEFSLSDACEEIVLSMESEAFEKNILFEYEIDEKVDYVGSEEEIKHLVAILLENAIKHTPSGGQIQLKLFIEKEHPILTVYNTGEGISDEAINHIFERFYSVNNNFKEKNSFGLGLSIAKTIVELHGGTISVKSEYKKDVIFICRL
ncbi:HAMP domain-containing histidine kinase [Eubacterium sp. MSJ-13]|uniref:sensor histidine kinase n=1 Tax=Eubacterium sp. MSJ-13 TaxID=2841513 RepID=UPI001C117409|nr:HAMP domain-containing sensor histidine kinase [Eubacterium sp. MSJ-13]MBU5477659.1 HAMP domain-containing histidine kinase [Eubacterium sp. MSJ-13]